MDIYIKLWDQSLLLILPEMSGYVKTFKNKDGDKDKNKNNKLMFSHGADDKLLKNI